jgi:hypothetical protein
VEFGESCSGVKFSGLFLNPIGKVRRGADKSLAFPIFLFAAQPKDGLKNL